MAIIFTDGAAKGNQNKQSSYCGWGVYNHTTKETLNGILDSKTIKNTNNRAEGTAIMKAIEMAKDGDTIYTDSKLWVNLIVSWMPKWERTGVDFNSKANPDLTTAIHALNKTKSINYVWVPCWHDYKNPPKTEHEILIYTGNKLAEEAAEKLWNRR